jgi:4-hydroxy 2-oxovalerate aldolase
MIELHDLTLRDGNHAIGHKLSIDDIEDYCKFAEESCIHVIEVGHGNGLGASSISLGESLTNDFDSITLARKILHNTKLSVHIIPGLATIERDIKPAMDMGVDIFRVATHCTEASLAKSHIEYLYNNGKTVYGVLMMSAVCTDEVLVEEANKLKSYGANTVIIMDSSGSYIPSEVYKRVSKILKLGVRVGFHGHNNFNLAVANSLSAISAGATIIDVTMRGFGAGAGNTPLEVIANITENNLNKDLINAKCNFFKYNYPISRPINILTAKHKLFSGFDKIILEVCIKYNLPMSKFVKSLEGLTAGQDDIIRTRAETFH